MQLLEFLKNLESDDAIAILENVDEKDKNSILSAITTQRSFCFIGRS